jgi:hypothetical protein
MNYKFLGAKAQYAADMLGLSLLGALRIVPYNEACHDYVTQKYANSKAVKQNTIRDPLGFYLFLCNKYCQEKHIAIDFTPYNALIKKYEADLQGDPYVPVALRVNPELPLSSNTKRLYPVYKPTVRPLEDPIRADANIESWKRSEQYKKFTAIFGEPVAVSMCDIVKDNALGKR